MLHVFLLELLVVEIGVVAFVLKQLFVRALLDDLACADDQNKVGVADGCAGRPARLLQTR